MSYIFYYAFKHWTLSGWQQRKASRPAGSMVRIFALLIETDKCLATPIMFVY